MLLEQIMRLNILQSGSLNIEELDTPHYVLKHYKKRPVIFMNEPIDDCTEILYNWIIDNEIVSWYPGMTETHKKFRIKNKRIFCDDNRPFDHPSNDDLNLALRTCKTAVCLIWFVKKDVRKLEKHLIWELRNAGCTLINKQLYPNYEGY